MTLSRRTVLIALPLAAALPVRAQQSTPLPLGASRMTAYAFSFAGPDGETISLADYAGKPLLIVNTASFCGYTNQFGGLAALDQKYRDRGLVVIGVPSNDFGAQEPGGPQEIAATASQYGVKFLLTAKTVVRGANAHRFYKWAAAERPRETPSWNFHKYLIGRDGTLAASFPTQTRPDDPKLIAAIERELES